MRGCKVCCFITYMALTFVLCIVVCSHGWPSFRDEEVVWDNVRCLSDGEAVSVDGTHLGHNLPDNKGSRYCINLVSVAGRPSSEK